MIGPPTATAAQGGNRLRPSRRNAVSHLHYVVEIHEDESACGRSVRSQPQRCVKLRAVVRMDGSERCESEEHSIGN